MKLAIIFLCGALAGVILSALVIAIGYYEMMARM